MGKTFQYIYRIVNRTPPWQELFRGMSFSYFPPAACGAGVWLSIPIFLIIYMCRTTSIYDDDGCVLDDVLDTNARDGSVHSLHVWFVWALVRSSSS